MLAGFVISFSNNPPVKPRPVLKPRPVSIAGDQKLTTAGNTQQGAKVVVGAGEGAGAGAGAGVSVPKRGDVAANTAIGQCTFTETLHMI